jgi:hypothetical protein
VQYGDIKMDFKDYEEDLKDNTQDDPYKIFEKSEAIMERLTKQYPKDEEKFMIEAQREATKMILDVLEQAFPNNIDIKTLVQNFRKEFFVDGSIKFKVVMKIATDILDLVSNSNSDDELVGLCETLIEALDGQKAYHILKFK